MAVIYR